MASPAMLAALTGATLVTGPASGTPEQAVSTIAVAAARPATASRRLAMKHLGGRWGGRGRVSRTRLAGCSYWPWQQGRPGGLMAGGLLTGLRGLDHGVLGLQRQRRVVQRLSRPPRQGQPEVGSLPWRAPGLQPATVQAGILEGDGQAEARATGGPGPGRVGPPEAVEHQGALTRSQTDTVVPYADRDRIVVGPHRHEDRLLLTV